MILVRILFFVGCTLVLVAFTDGKSADHNINNIEEEGEQNFLLKTKHQYQKDENHDNHQPEPNTVSKNKEDDLIFINSSHHKTLIDEAEHRQNNDVDKDNEDNKKHEHDDQISDIEKNSHSKVNNHTDRQKIQSIDKENQNHTLDKHNNNRLNQSKGENSVAWQKHHENHHNHQHASNHDITETHENSVTKGGSHKHESDDSNNNHTTQNSHISKSDEKEQKKNDVDQENHNNTNNHLSNGGQKQFHSDQNFNKSQDVKGDLPQNSHDTHDNKNGQNHKNKNVKVLGINAAYRNFDNDVTVTVIVLSLFSNYLLNVLKVD